jgi:hypothetical protein
MALQIALTPLWGVFFSTERVRLLCTRTPPGIKVSRKPKNIFAKILKSVTFGSLGNAVQKFKSLRTSG